ncbi:MAG TPA: hypothetical protein VLE49_21565 [Anaerolineales bacterium]|nr:hypothetical protein [Anaerolineales bacterium]
MNSLLHDVGKYLLETWGRSRPTPRYPFADNEIVTPGIPMRVSSWWNATYINLHPTHYAVAIAPDGRIINLKGGYNYPLSGGQYILHYIDKQNRVSVIPRTSETTLDGSQVSLELVITYRVVDPLKALEVQQPVNTLFIFIQSDLKEFIRSHKYDEIVGSSDGRTAENGLVARYIKEQHAGRHQMSKLFFIADVVVEEKVGDPKLTEIRENFQAEQRQNTVKSELLEQNQNLERKIASQEAEIRRIKAQSDAAQQDILQSMQFQKIELEKARMALQFRQDKMMRAMDAIAKAFSTPAYPRDPREVEIIKELLGALGGDSTTDAPPPEGATGPEGRAAAEPSKTPNPEKIDALTDTLLSWLDRRRS